MNTSTPPFKNLNINFDTISLLKDLEHVETLEWLDHVDTAVYSGKWDVLPLRCSKEHIEAHPILQGFSIDGVEQWQYLPIVDQCPGFKQVLSLLESQGCEIHSVRLMRLQAGAEIGEHRDRGLSYLDGEMRLHIPITTNPKVEFLVDRQAALMQPGELWYIDADRPHSVANRGECDRVHLVIDGVINSWIDNQLAS